MHAADAAGLALGEGEGLAAVVARVLQLAFLAPPIIDAVVTGQQPIELTSQRLMTLRDMPHSWTSHMADLGFAAN